MLILKKAKNATKNNGMITRPKGCDSATWMRFLMSAMEYTALCLIARGTDRSIALKAVVSKGESKMCEFQRNLENMYLRAAILLQMVG